MSYAQREACDPAQDFPAEFGFAFSTEEINAKITRKRRDKACSFARAANYSEESLKPEPQIALIYKKAA